MTDGLARLGAWTIARIARIGHGARFFARLLWL